MPIYELEFANLGPFDEISFEFDPQINVFVGPNNSGKSTALMAIADLAVRDFAVPAKLLRKQPAPFRTLMGTTPRKRVYCDGEFSIKGEKPQHWNKERLELVIGRGSEAGYACLIPALRWSTDYRAESAKPVDAAPIRKRPDGRRELVLRAVHEGEIDLSRPHASVMWDRDVVQKIIDLDYRSYRTKNPAIRQLLRKISAIASEITDGFPIKFVGVAEDREGLYPEFETPDGKMPLNVLSQGTQSIIQWLGMLLIGYAEYYKFPKDLEDKPGIVIIDEIDAHMHPSWQRRILPTLSRNFPNLQIFCSSHSPFVLAGLKAGQAQLLERDAKGKVGVSRNPSDLVGWSMDEILRNLLDITNPTDLRTSDNIDRLQELRRKKRLTKKQKDELECLRATLSRDLLAGPASMEVERIAERIREPAAKTAPARKTAPVKKKAKKAPAARTRKNGAKRSGGRR